MGHSAAGQRDMEKFGSSVFLAFLIRGSAALSVDTVLQIFFGIFLRQSNPYFTATFRMRMACVKVKGLI